MGAFVLTVLVVMLPVLLDNNWHAFWRDSIAYQARRASPFSIWGLWGGLGLEQHLVQGAPWARRCGRVRAAPAGRDRGRGARRGDVISASS